MTQQQPGFKAQIKSYPTQFWVANTMEIFERMSWYGWFTVMAVYVTGTVETGGLGFTAETRGNLQAFVTSFLYFMPVLTGALADRYGFKRMFVIAYSVMIISYYLLGQFATVPTFFMAFMFVAVGAAIFKPVVVGTVAKVTNDSNSATGFGIFYMMVNVGGFLGPIVAGYVRGWGWEWVFVACSAWAAVNLILVLVFYKEPKTVGAESDVRTFKKVLDNLVEVLGNLRFFITVGVVLAALQLASLGFAWFTWTHCLIFVPAWIVLNFVWDAVIRAGGRRAVGRDAPRRFFLLKRMHCSNWRFALFLLIMSGFWTSFNQIFYTMPEYIRDFTDTRPLISFAESIFGESDPNDPTVGIASKIATISEEERMVIRGKVDSLIKAQDAGTLDEDMLSEAAKTLLYTKVRLLPAEIESLVTTPGAEVERVTDRVIIQGRQVNPEFIINIDALAIVFFQVLVSFTMGRFHRFTTMVIGMVVAAVGIGLSMLAGDLGMVSAGGMVWVVAGGILIFAFGEMMASPTSQEYVGRIAPADRKALYMGYYFVAVALGNLFGGILSGQLYGWLARDLQRPDLMWLCFGVIMLFTAFVFLLYNKLALPKHAADMLTNSSQSE